MDDNLLVLDAVCNFLKSCELATAVFISAEDFLASPNLKKTNCLILDLDLPGMSGLELQRRLTAENHRIPIIFMSGRDEQKKREEALQAGAVDFLNKPCSGIDLYSAIKAALNRQACDQSNATFD